MKLAILVLAAGCILMAATLLYLLWVAHARREQLGRLMGLLRMEYPPAVVVGEYSISVRSLVPATLARKCRQAGWNPQSRDLAAMFIGFLVATGIAIEGFGALGGGVAAVTALMAANGTLEIAARKRIRALSDAMLGFLERTRQLIAVGNSLAVSLERAVANSPPAVAGAMSPTIRRIRNGSGVADSLERCAMEFDIYELHLLATAARTNLRFGGSMTQILRNMIENVRRRTSIERELRAGTTQIRASAWVLGLLPMLVAAIVMLSNHDYARWFLETRPGHAMIAYALVSQLVGAWLMRMITRTQY